MIMQFFKLWAVSSFLQYFTAYLCILAYLCECFVIPEYRAKLDMEIFSTKAWSTQRDFAAKSTSDRTGFTGTWISVDWVWASAVTKVDQGSQFLGCSKEWQRSSFSKEAGLKSLPKGQQHCPTGVYAIHCIWKLYCPSPAWRARQGEQEKNKMNTKGEEWVMCQTTPVANLALPLIPSWGT